MPIAASAIVQRAIDVLNDANNKHWKMPELARWFNDAQREIVIHKPEASAATSLLTLTSGATKQSISGVSGALRLLSAVRNFSADGLTPGRAVRLMSRDLLDAAQPTWHTDAGAAEVKGYIYDSRDPKTFYVYPKPAGATKLEVVLSMLPAEVTESGGVVSGNLALDDIYAGAVTDYILFRTFSKDAVVQASAARAIAHFNAFATSVGIKKMSDRSTGPVANSSFDPTNPVAQTGGSAA